MRNSIRIACWTVAVVFGLALVAFAFSYRGGATPQSQNPKGTVKGPQFEAELITLQEWGFEPKEITRPAGPFTAIFKNHSGLRDVELSLVQESGSVLNKIPVTRHALNSRQRLQLPPGTYLVKEKSHPDWVCRITISHP